MLFSMTSKLLSKTLIAFPALSRAEVMLPMVIPVLSLNCQAAARGERRGLTRRRISCGGRAQQTGPPAMKRRAVFDQLLHGQQVGLKRFQLAHMVEGYGRLGFQLLFDRTQRRRGFREPGHTAHEFPWRLLGG